MRRVTRFAATGLILGSLFAACTIEPSELRETEERYLQRIESSLQPMRQSTEAFDRLYQKTTSRTAFADGIRKIPFRSRIVRVFRRLRNIEPPPRFFDDQRKLLKALVDMAPLVRAAEELVSESELVRASARYAQSYVLYEQALTDQSSRFCLVSAGSRAERDLCDPAGILPGGGYGDRLHAILARASAEFTPRGFSFVARAFNNREVAHYLQRVGPSLVDGVREARDEIRKLVPPDEFAADQRILDEYFDEIRRVSQEIAVAANENPEGLFRLFPRSQQLVNRARDQLSDDIRPAVAVWFFPSD